MISLNKCLEMSRRRVCSVHQELSGAFFQFSAINDILANAYNVLPSLPAILSNLSIPL